jgi:hypothetical protein
MPRKQNTNDDGIGDATLTMASTPGGVGGGGGGSLAAPPGEALPEGQAGVEVGDGRMVLYHDSNDTPALQFRWSLPQTRSVP